MQKLSNYLLTRKINETRHSIIYRGHREDDEESVIIKVLKAQYSTPSEIARFKQEYNLIKTIKTDGIIISHDIVEHNHTHAIIEEDFDGISLKEILQTKKLGIKSFLQIALKLSETLGIIHKNNIIHLDIKPDNILINAKKGIVKITDFGISAVLTHANDELYNPEVIEGTLPYISPEQTGRMHRNIDYRTDLYSLGVTFYEMLTGSVPFKSKDPMELIHSHIARSPAAPNELEPSVPAVISDIIMKLLSKTPEERYQNSLGLMADIKECLRQLNTGNIIDRFPLASRDISIYFNIPQILVGRDEELNELMSAFERSSRGAGEMMLVLGHPGIGKSALIDEIQRPIVGEKGYFISGKYDQFRKDVPYSSIIQAFQGLIKQLLSESDDRISSWREKLLAALGPNGKVITDVIPDMEYIIGKQPDVETLGPEESQNRFNFVFRNFVKVFTTADHPITLFLDDLQWADMASLELIKTIMTGSSIKFLFLIGAYRDNEVSRHHPLSITLDEIRKRGTKINSISLTSLNSMYVNKMIMNVLRCKAEKSATLAELVYKKTAGNPFFVNQFLKNLYVNRSIELDPKTGWSWDIDKIQEMQFTDNVVEFMAGKISDLPIKTQEILKTCACIGNRFDLETLSIILGKTIEEILADITAAIQQDLVNLYGNIYKFHHDRIQEAAYSLIPESEKTILHNLIGKNVLEKTPEQYLDDKIFYIVDQLNRGINLITKADERLRLAEMNLRAAQKAKNSAAYASALNYVRTGIGLLSDNSWLDYYKLTYDLHNEMLECEYLTGEFVNAEKTFNLIVQNAKTNLERANLHSQMIILKNSTGDYKSALKIGFAGMKMIGMKLPGKVSDLRLVIELLKLRLRFGRKRIEDLADMPLALDNELLAYAYLCIYMGNSAYFVDLNLFSFIVTKGINILIKHGNFEFSPFAYNAMGSILGSGLGLYNQGYRFGQTSLNLYNKMGGIKSRSKILHLFVFFILHWKEHAKHGLDYEREAYKAGLQAGDLLYCGYNINVLAMHRIILGDNLDEILEEYVPYREFQMNARDPFTPRNYMENIQMIRCLKGETTEKGSLNGDGFDEDEQCSLFITDGNMLGQIYSLTVMLRLRYLFGLFNDCVDICQKLSNLIKNKAAIGTLHIPEFYFYYSLQLAATYICSGFARRIRSGLRLTLNQMKMKTWARICPENFEHKYLLVEAERARLKGNRKKASMLYDRAIKSARENQYTQNEAIANELAALFTRETGDMEKARRYMKEAHYGYIKWGAAGKVKDLEAKYPDLISDKTREPAGRYLPSDTGTTTIITGSASSQILDLSTIIKTSQALSSEIDLDKLLVNIMKLSIENAGAQNGYLILENDDNKKLSIMAAGKVDGTIEAMKSIPLEGNDSLSESIVNYVHKTGENIVLGNACADQRFVNDPYVIKNQPKSTLCAPIMHKGKPIGIIYLENNLTTDAFTPERLELLQIFSAQAAISIENSRLILQRERAAKLQTEMTIAANIQTMLLPDEPTIQGFEITAYMKPADEVGGDYYDIINTDSHDWVVIGDVSGHGVPAGLIMMMVQSTIQALVRKYPAIKPSELLAIVNEMIKYNVCRMNDQKYMTITAFSFGKDGKTVYSGLHQNILVYRESSGNVESIPSDGIWLSPWDMGQENVDRVLSLNKGDVLLLYTDGVTEPINASGKMFSEEKLAEVLKESGRLKTDEIRDNILGSIEGYKLNDDVTLVLLKCIENA